MLDDTRKKLLKLLVALAWADGKVDAEEMEVVEAMFDSFNVDPQTAKKMRQWAKTPRSLEEVGVDGLTKDDGALVLYQAVLLTYIDGEQTEKEIALLDEFMSKLGLTKEESEPILEQATKRAKELLPVLAEESSP